jgi:hypothetical protein
MRRLLANPKIGKSASSAETDYEPTRTGLSPSTLARALRDNLYYTQGRFPEAASRHEWYAALAVTVRDRLLQRWIKSVHTLMHQDTRVVSYLSAEFLMGPHLGNALVNLGIFDQTRQAVTQLGLDLDDRLPATSDLHQAIDQKFREAGLSIAFPQRDIHLDMSRPLDIRILREKAMEFEHSRPGPERGRGWTNSTPKSGP